MTASMPTHSSFWDRVLPAPPALLNSHASDTFSRRSSSHLQHHLVSSKDCLAAPKDRRSTVPSISYSVKPSVNPIPPIKPHSSQEFPRLALPEIGSPTKKRAASLMAAESHSRESSPPARSISIAETTNQFCLCQPDPKIPRPRNAFILYRQHHQAAVVDKHPGLPNPEISKIIGEEWRALPPDTKSLWKALAEDEKTRHQQQYPDYRYQPRRLGRNAPPPAATALGATGPAGNCLRCGGKTMNPPVTPHTPAFPPNGAPTSGGARSPEIRNASISQAPRRPHLQGHAGVHRQLPYTVPSPPLPGSAMTRVRPFGEVYVGGVLSNGHEAEYRARYANQPMSPSPKRRRYNGPGVMVPGRATEATSPVTAYPPSHLYSPRRVSVSQGPEAGMFTTRHRSPTHALHMPRANPPQHARYASVGTRDPGLTLAPLKTPTSATGATGSNDPKRATNCTTAEAQIMSIPAVNKLRLLAKAAPPLPYPGSMTKPKSSAGQPSTLESRGAILAVEGSEEDVRMMTEWLAEFLNHESDGFRVKEFVGPDIGAVMAKAGSEGDADMVGTQQQCYLKAISEWHRVSQEVVKFVTTTATATTAPAPATVTAPSPKHDSGTTIHMTCHATEQGSGKSGGENETEEMDIDTTSPLSPGTSSVSPHTFTHNQTQPKTNPRPSPPPSPPRCPPSTSTTAATTAASAPNPAPSSNIDTTTTTTTTTTTSFPIALIPRYQLSTVDTASVSMPITDSYLPTDHWQWAAALWRGCAGPDVTIVIQDSVASASSSTTTSSSSSSSSFSSARSGIPGGNANASGNGNGGAGVCQGGPATAGATAGATVGATAAGGVEVRLCMADVRAVVVRKGVGRSPAAGTAAAGGTGNMVIEPGQLRRVGFEIVEFLRR